MGAVQGPVRTWLRIEGICMLAAALLAYRHYDFGWGALLVFFMAPDLSMLAYLRGPRIGAAVYNAAHALLGPSLLLAWGLGREPALVQAALIWFAHIGFCRAARFGLKYADAFDDTHLGTPPVNLPAFVAGLLRRA